MRSVSLKAITYQDLPDWKAAGLDLSFAAFRRSAQEMLTTATGFARSPAFGGTRDHWREACTEALNNARPDDFFERCFTPLVVTDPERPDGLFTGYYEPQAEASRLPHPDYPVPLYRKPDDLVAFTQTQVAETGLSYGRMVDGQPAPYLSRREIENGALAGRGLEFAWLKSWEDAFFIHIQGQGRLHMADGTVMRLAYAAKSGRPYTGIGSLLIARGALTASSNSMQAIRAWMSANPGQARQLMWENQSFIFFRPVDVDAPGIGSLGAQRVNLTPRRSLAVDRNIWMFGTPLWLETAMPPEAGGQLIRELMIAQDTGTAIRGAARGDVYWGWGDDAAHIAGHMKSSGRLVALLPHALAQSILSGMS